MIDLEILNIPGDYALFSIQIALLCSKTGNCYHED